MEHIPQKIGMDGVWGMIAQAARTCYATTPNAGEGDEEFVKRAILKPALITGNLDNLATCEFNLLRLHGGVLEFGTVYLSHVPETALDFYRRNPYSMVGLQYVNEAHDCYYYVTTNFRVILENKRWDDLEYMTDPTIWHKKRYCFKVVTNIGVTREFNRHRASMSVVEQSTRYCDYASEGKFGGDLTFIKPAWVAGGLDELNEMCPHNVDVSDYMSVEKAHNEIRIQPTTDAIGSFLEGLFWCEISYKQLRRTGWKPEKARSVLPLATKTTAMYCASAYSWNHFLLLRKRGVSGTPHPDIKIVAELIADELDKLE